MQTGDVFNYQNILKHQVPAIRSALGWQLDPTGQATSRSFHGVTNSIWVDNAPFVSDGVGISSAELTLDLMILTVFSNLNPVIL